MCCKERREYRIRTHRRKVLTVWRITSALLAFSTCLSAQASCPDMTRYCEKLLKNKGFSVDTPEQIIEATKDESYFTRHVALELLTYRTQKQAIPVLLQALEDEHIYVRITAAHFLGTLGDNSGLERMRQDFAELVPRVDAAEPGDPNMTKVIMPLERWDRSIRHRIRRALEVALVLAELGDRGGYELAAKIVIESPAEQARLAEKGEDQAAGSIAVKRKRAVKVLAEIAKTDQKTLDAENRRPAALLSALAASEKRSTVFSQVLTAALRLRGDIGIQILDRAKDNPHQAQQYIRRATSFLESVKKQKQVTQNQ